MASNPSIFSPSASSFLTAPSVAGLNGSGSSSPAEPDSPSLSTGSNGIVTVDSERWTPSEYSDFTALSAVSSATPSILSMNNSMPGTNGVPTAPQSPAREAVNDNVNTDNSTSIDTIRPESRWQDREKTPSRASTFSLLRYLSALPAPSGSGSDAFNSFEFPGIGQDAGSATQQQQSAEPEPSPSPFPQYPYPIPQPPTLPSTYPDPPMTSLSPPATVSTNLLDDSRQPSPAPSESVERLAADLMAFSMTASSEEPAERRDPEEPTTSTLPPSPPTPTSAPNATTTTTYEYTEPLPKPESESVDLPVGQGSFSGVGPAGASIPLNATTASGGFSHSTTQRWPWMDIGDELFSNQGVDAGRYDGAPLPHIMQVLPGPRPPVEVDGQQPADEAPHLLGSLAAPAPAPAPPSTTVFSEDEGLASGPPSAQPPPYYPLPALWSGFGPAADTQADAVSAPPNSTANYSSTLEQAWIQAYSVPTRPLFVPQQPAYPDAPSHPPIPTNASGPQFGTGSFDFSLGVGDADATPRGAGLGGDSWRVGSLQAGWDVPRAPGSYGASFGVNNDHSNHHEAVQPHLPYRVPSPSSFRSTPTPQLPPATPGQTHPSFGCPLFASPSPSANTVSTEADSVYGLKRVTPTTQQQSSSDQGFQTSEEDEPRDKGKGRLAVNTEEARLAYERAVEARKKFRGEAVSCTVHRPFGPLFDMDGPSSQKAYQDAVQARDLLTQRYSTTGARISQSAFGQPAAPHSPTQHSDFGPPFSPVQDMSYDLHSYFPASAVPRLQTVSGPNHPTIEQYPTIQSPVASLEAIPIVPVSAPPVRRRGTPGPEQNDWKDVKQWSMEDEMASANREINERSHVETETKESSHATQEFATGYPAPKYQPGGHRNTPQASPFIPPSRTSSASTTSMYVISSAPPPLQCRPPPSPTSSTTSSDAPRILPRRRSQRSIRRSTSSHTIPAVSFVLPGPTNTTQTGSPVQGPSNPIHNFQSSYPGMSSGKLSTLNFNESTRPSPWISQVPTGNTSHWGASSGPGPMGGRSQSGFGCGFGSGGFNATPNDNQVGSSWPFAPLPNVTPTPAQWPFGGWGTGTPGQQQTPNGPWQQSSAGWGGPWLTHPGNTPPGVLFPPQAPMMSTTILPPSTSGPGTAARNTSLPFTQSTALPTYPLPAGQYPGNSGVQSQFMTPHGMNVPAHATDPYAVRTAPPPYNTSPNGIWGNPGPHVQVTPPGPTGMGRYPLHSKYCFSDSNVAFVVQGTEYRVHRFFFEKHSNQMKELLACYPPGLYHSMEPIPLAVSGADFDKLLSIFYPSNPLQSDLTEADDFARVIRASQQLGFQDMRKSVIQMASKLSPVERILLSRSHDVKELAIPAYEELCASGKPVSPEDGEKLGAATVIRIWEVQQQLSAQEFCRDGCRKEFLESTVKEKFVLE